MEAPHWARICKCYQLFQSWTPLWLYRLMVLLLNLVSESFDHSHSIMEHQWMIIAIFQIPFLTDRNNFDILCMDSRLIEFQNSCIMIGNSHSKVRLFIMSFVALYLIYICFYRMISVRIFFWNWWWDHRSFLVYVGLDELDPWRDSMTVEIWMDPNLTFISFSQHFYQIYL